jgi:hypothetical protein
MIQFWGQILERLVLSLLHILHGLWACGTTDTGENRDDQHAHDYSILDIFHLFISFLCAQNVKSFFTTQTHLFIVNQGYIIKHRFEDKN